LNLCSLSLSRNGKFRDSDFGFHQGQNSKLCPLGLDQGRVLWARIFTFTASVRRVRYPVMPIPPRIQRASPPDFFKIGLWLSEPTPPHSSTFAPVTRQTSPTVTFARSYSSVRLEAMLTKNEQPQYRGLYSSLTHKANSLIIQPKNGMLNNLNSHCGYQRSISYMIK
jgi:hypothetical protein